jgi:hypothetical protein
MELFFNFVGVWEMQEVRRIKSQHLNDRNAIVNRRVMGKLSVTRAFGPAT